jgi:hypothetical protein
MIDLKIKTIQKKTFEFEVVSVSTVNIVIFWEVTPWSQVRGYRNLQGASDHAMNLHEYSSSVYIRRSEGRPFREDSNLYTTVTNRSNLNSKYRLIYKTFSGKDDFMSNIFVYAIGSVFTVKLFLFRQINLFYLLILFTWCMLKLCLDKLIIICFHNDL